MGMMLKLSNAPLITLFHRGKQIGYNPYFVTIINKRKSQEVIFVTPKMLRKWWPKHVNQHSVAWGRHHVWRFGSTVQVTHLFALLIIKLQLCCIFYGFLSVRKWHWIKIRTCHFTKIHVLMGYFCKILENNHSI